MGAQPRPNGAGAVHIASMTDPVPAGSVTPDRGGGDGGGGDDFVDEDELRTLIEAHEISLREEGEGGEVEGGDFNDISISETFFGGPRTPGGEWEGDEFGDR